MKKQLFFIIICLLPFFLNAQSNIPIQGKLLDNSGAPVTGQRNFTATLFAPNSNTVLWSGTYNNTAVINGLYNLVLNTSGDTFRNAFSNNGNVLDIEIKVNGQALQRFKIYAPIESDPSIPSNLKDGVSWSEISNKPTIDNSNSNELQELIYQNGTLSITNGNSINLPLLSSDVNIPSSLTVGSSSTANSTILEQNTSSTQTFINTSVWQSFSLNEGGELSAIKLQFGNSNNIDIRLKIFHGNGNDSQPIFESVFNAVQFSSAVSLQTFTINSPQPVILEGGTNYTIEFSGLGAGFLIAINTNNPYPFGTTSLDANTDLQFAVDAVQTSSYSLSVSEDFVEFGAPEVSTTGRYYDKSGVVMPIGAIMPYAGHTPPEGWLLCNGQEVSRVAYTDLFNAIGTAWGWGNGASTFNIPDLRGQFLRGVDDGAAMDTNAAERHSLHQGGNSGDNVGSFQDDEVGDHAHEYKDVVHTEHSGQWDHLDADNVTIPFNIGSKGGTDFDNTGAQFTRTTESGGGAETRPKNANVHYIIKY